MKAIVVTLPSEKPIGFAGKKGERFLDGMVRFFEAEGVFCERVSYNDPEIWEKMRKADFLICRPKGNETDIAIASSLIQEAESLGLTCFPSSKEVFYCGDKYRVEGFFAANNLPRPDTHAIFQDEDLEKIERFVSFPAVVKLIRGASSRNVALAHGKGELRKIWRSLKRLRLKDGELSEFSERWKFISVFNLFWQRHKVMKEKCLIVQELIPDCSGDVRVTTFKDRAYVFERKNRPGDFRASGSGSIEYEPMEYHSSLAKSAIELSSRFGFNSMAYDFLIGKNGKSYFIEMNYTFVPQAVAACPVFYDYNGTSNISDSSSPQELIGRGLIEQRRNISLAYDSGEGRI